MYDHQGYYVSFYEGTVSMDVLGHVPIDGKLTAWIDNTDHKFMDLIEIPRWWCAL